MRVAASGASRSRLFTAPSMSWISRSPMGCRGRLALVVRASSSWSRMQSPSWFGSRHRRRSSDGLRARSFGTLGAPGAGEGSAHQIAALVAWLRAHGVDFTDRAAFCRVRGMGVGGVATRDFAQGDVIFSLPLRAPVSTADPPAPLVMTTSIVTSHVGPLGRLGRALAVAGLTLPTRDLAASPAPSHRLGGVVESHHDFPAPRVARLAPRARHSPPVRPRRGTEPERRALARVRKPPPPRDGRPRRVVRRRATHAPGSAHAREPRRAATSSTRSTATSSRPSYAPTRVFSARRRRRR